MPTFRNKVALMVSFNKNAHNRFREYETIGVVLLVEDRFVPIVYSYIADDLLKMKNNIITKLYNLCSVPGRLIHVIVDDHGSVELGQEICERFS